MKNLFILLAFIIPLSCSAQSVYIDTVSNYHNRLCADINPVAIPFFSGSVFATRITVNQQSEYNTNGNITCKWSLDYEIGGKWYSITGATCTVNIGSDTSPYDARVPLFEYIANVSALDNGLQLNITYK